MYFMYTYLCIHTFTSVWKVCKCLCEHKCFWFYSSTFVTWLVYVYILMNTYFMYTCMWRWHVTHINEPCHTCMWMSHVSNLCSHRHLHTPFLHLNVTCHTYEQATSHIRMRARHTFALTWTFTYGVATISRLLKIIGLFCRI